MRSASVGEALAHTQRLEAIAGDLEQVSTRIAAVPEPLAQCGVYQADGKAAALSDCKIDVNKVTCH